MPGRKAPGVVSGRVREGAIMTNSLLDAVQHHPFTQGLTPEHCETLASLAHQASFAKDEIIFCEGDPKHEFFLLLSGRVALEMAVQGRTLRVHHLEAGDELGWSAVLMGGGKRFQARALEPVEALAFDGYKLLEICRTDHFFGYKIMHRMLATVSERLQAARMQVLDMYSPIAKKAGA
jgi:CRP/FNR family cyclic AMP-dependent transcriptional regulator